MRKFFPALLAAILLASCTTPSSSSTPIHPASTLPNIIIPTPPACTTAQAAPTPGADTPSVFPPESAADHVRGAKNPIVTITEYLDYQDLRSGLFTEVTNRLLKEHSDEVRVVSRVFPLISVNDKAALAAQAAEAAQEQNQILGDA